MFAKPRPKVGSMSPRLTKTSNREVAFRRGWDERPDSDTSFWTTEAQSLSALLSHPATAGWARAHAPDRTCRPERGKVNAVWQALLPIVSALRFSLLSQH